MSVSIVVQNDNFSLSIDVTKYDMSIEGIYSERVCELKDLFIEIISADIEANKTSKSRTLNRQRALMAIDLKYQMALRTTLQLAKLKSKIADGSALIEENGFPEFSDE